MQKSQRQIRMIMMINARKSFTVKELAEELGLSTRTITRDLQELSELGVPIYSVQGRGGGYKLLQERQLPPISFTEGEATAMFFACQSLEYFSALPFGHGAETALDKFYQYLPADVKRQIDRMRNKVMLWNPYRRMSSEVLQTLLLSIMNRSVVTIEYRSSRGGSKRNIQPIGLYSSSGYWYCPAYCFLREEIRQFRADRILSASLTETCAFREDIDRMTIHNKPGKESVEQTVLRVELTQEGVWQLESNPRFAEAFVRNPDGSATAALPIPTEDLAYYVDLLWNLGREVKIVEPAEALEYIKQKIESMRQLYG